MLGGLFFFSFKAQTSGEVADPDPAQQLLREPFKAQTSGEVADPDSAQQLLSASIVQGAKNSMV